jgi:GH18 family chitinase
VYLCATLSDSYAVAWHDLSFTNFFAGNQWVSYDNPASLQVKLNYLTSNNLRGAMVWTVDANHTLTDYIAAKLST